MNEAKNKLATVVIAAGTSSRLGQPKQLIEYRGSCLLESTLERANRVSHNAVCVLGAQANDIIQQLGLSEEQIVINQEWRVGMGTSIAAGVEYLSNSINNDSIEAILVLLCDQYLLTDDDLNQLVKHWLSNTNHIVASSYYNAKYQRKILGAPAIFPREYFSALAKLKVEGARGILNNKENSVIEVDITNASIDLDTPEDLEKLYTTS